ncbi:MAG: hypothetical protein GXO55_08525 [Chloroflexi bacterium]|nr:hypothetical protein [Chloroflexota bacterium]
MDTTTHANELQRLILEANKIMESGQLEEALRALARVGELATDLGEWDTAIRAHQITAEAFHQGGNLGAAFSHAAEGLYLSLEHAPDQVLPALGQILAFMEKAIAERRYYVAEEVGPGLLRELEHLTPAEGAEVWRDLARELAIVIMLVGDAKGDEEHPSFVEALTRAALVDRGTKGRLNLNMWVHSTAIRAEKVTDGQNSVAP